MWNWNICWTIAFPSARCRSYCTTNFCAAKRCWWSPAPTEKPLPLQCSRGFLRARACEPSFLIGGIAENFGSSFQIGAGKHFILEGDEYDTAFFDKGPKFLHYFPDRVILTSVEFDHADIYKDLDAVETSFKRLVNLIPRRGNLIAFDTGESVERCIARAFCAVERYGSNSKAGWRITNLRTEPTRTSWSVLRHGKPWGDFEFALAGEYNVWNATAAAALAATCGVPQKQIAEALKTFKSVKRRLEVRAQLNGITIIEDFAHHPTAIQVTLKALRSRYPGARLWAILEPRSNTLRRNVFQQELGKSLSGADEVVIANVFKSDAIPEDQRLNLAAVADANRKKWAARADCAGSGFDYRNGCSGVALWGCSGHSF